MNAVSKCGGGLTVYFDEQKRYLYLKKNLQGI
jgi:hypothetical protein